MELQRVFRMMDLDSSGQLDYKEFRDGILLFNIDVLSETQMMDLFSSLDANGDGSIDYDEFLNSFCIVDLHTETTETNDQVRLVKKIDSTKNVVEEAQRVREDEIKDKNAPTRPASAELKHLDTARKDTSPPPFTYSIKDKEKERRIEVDLQKSKEPSIPFTRYKVRSNHFGYRIRIPVEAQQQQPAYTNKPPSPAAPFRRSLSSARIDRDTTVDFASVKDTSPKRKPPQTTKVPPTYGPPISSFISANASSYPNSSSTHPQPTTTVPSYSSFGFHPPHNSNSYSSVLQGGQTRSSLPSVQLSRRMSSLDLNPPGFGQRRLSDRK
eukprot:TRINITY_DN17647_c0_g1_i1.p1 TRINITY_DN17647_c0_g1~~TRINITY_DN17647_c0_g1_i1.p1  ORF type:complete len:374 (-),score=99.02 TRINITY_DN17647_c0_g1_i1:75-1049(-)